MWILCVSCGKYTASYMKHFSPVTNLMCLLVLLCISCSQSSLPEKFVWEPVMAKIWKHSFPWVLVEVVVNLRSKLECFNMKFVKIQSLVVHSRLWTFLYVNRDWGQIMHSEKWLHRYSPVVIYLFNSRLVPKRWKTFEPFIYKNLRKRGSKQRWYTQAWHSTPDASLFIIYFL